MSAIARLVENARVIPTALQAQKAAQNVQTARSVRRDQAPAPPVPQALIGIALQPPLEQTHGNVRRALLAHTRQVARKVAQNAQRARSAKKARALALPVLRERCTQQANVSVVQQGNTPIMASVFRAKMAITVRPMRQAAQVVGPMRSQTRISQDALVCTRAHGQIAIPGRATKFTQIRQLAYAVIQGNPDIARLKLIATGLYVNKYNLKIKVGVMHQPFLKRNLILFLKTLFSECQSLRAQNTQLSS